MRLLTLLLAADALFIALHVLQLTSSRFNDPRLLLTTDRGFAETFQYVKEYWICWLLLLLATRSGHGVFVAWTAVFAYVLADDVLMLHERVGGWLSAKLTLQPVLGIGTQDVGELLVTATAGCLLLAPLAVSHLWAELGVRRKSTALAGLLAALVALGVGVDVVHELMPSNAWYHVVSIIEDGGEMVVISCIVAWSFAAVNKGGVADAEPRPNA